MTIRIDPSSGLRLATVEVFRRYSGPPLTLLYFRAWKP